MSVNYYRAFSLRLDTLIQTSSELQIMEGDLSAQVNELNKTERNWVVFTTLRLGEQIMVTVYCNYYLF